MAWPVDRSRKFHYPSWKAGFSRKWAPRPSSKERREAMTKECLMAAYGHGHVVFERLSEEHLLMHSRQTNDWTIVAMVEFHATKTDHWNLHIEIEQNRKERGSTRIGSMATAYCTFPVQWQNPPSSSPAPVQFSFLSFNLLPPGKTRSPPPRSARLAPAPPNRRRYQ